MKNILTLPLTCLLTLSLASCASIAEPGVANPSVASAPAPRPSQAQPQGQPQAERITDVDKFLAEIDKSLELARGGGYGRLKPGDMDRLKAARDSIKKLVDGHASVRELPPADRLALYSAEDLITSILRKDDKNRMVCKQMAQTGSRLRGVTECLTVGQREERALRAREGTDKAQNNLCTPGEGNSCIK